MTKSSYRLTYRPKSLCYTPFWASRGCSFYILSHDSFYHRSGDVGSFVVHRRYVVHTMFNIFPLLFRLWWGRFCWSCWYTFLGIGHSLQPNYSQLILARWLTAVALPWPPGGAAWLRHAVIDRRTRFRCGTTQPKVKVTASWLIFLIFAWNDINILWSDPFKHDLCID